MRIRTGATGCHNEYGRKAFRNGGQKMGGIRGWDVQSGGAALEYILVGTVALFISMALLKFSIGIYSDKIKEIGENTGIDFSRLNINPFSDS